jgi:hypothetical protein
VVNVARRVESRDGDLFEVELRAVALDGLGHLVGEPDELGVARPVEHVGVRVVELDQVVGWVAEVELELPRRQLDEPQPPRARDAVAHGLVRRVEVVDREADVVPTRRRVGFEEEMELQVSHAEPLHDRVLEARGWDPRHPEHVLVEAGRLLEVGRRDTHVVERRRPHRARVSHGAEL